MGCRLGRHSTFSFSGFCVVFINKRIKELTGTLPEVGRISHSSLGLDLGYLFWSFQSSRND